MCIAGTFEVKTHLSALLARVEAGEEIIITRRGKRIARITPEPVEGKEASMSPQQIMAMLRESSKGARLDGLSIKALRDAGRR